MTRRNKKRLFGMLLPQQLHIFLQNQTLIRHKSGMRSAYIPKMPGLVSDVGDGFFSGRISQNKAIAGGQFSECAAHAGMGKVWPDEINCFRGKPQINGQAGLMLAASGKGYVLAGEGLALLAHGVVPNGLLLVQTAPAGYGNNGVFALYCPDAGAQLPGGLPVQLHLRPAGVCTNQIRRFGDGKGVAGVHQQ